MADGVPPRPTVTVLIDGDDQVIHLAALLVMKRQTFTLEPSPSTAGRWLVGLLPEGAALMRAMFNLVDVGTVGEWEPGRG